jgi:hypothetical protein
MGMYFNVTDWIRHKIYGDGQVVEDREDRFLIHFVSSGEKIMLKGAIHERGEPPYQGFSFRKKSSAASIQV